MSQNLTCTQLGKYQPEKNVTLEGMVDSVKVMMSAGVPEGKVFVINDDDFWSKGYFDDTFKKLNRRILEGWIWHDFTKLRPETIHKIRKCRKLSLAKKKSLLS